MFFAKSAKGKFMGGGTNNYLNVVKGILNDMGCLTLVNGFSGELRTMIQAEKGPRLKN